jgi:DNA-binding MarR family transcriptional regulator
LFAKNDEFPDREGEVVQGRNGHIGGLKLAINKEAVQKETTPLMTLVDAANVAQRGLEKRLSHLQLSVAQERILAMVYFAKEPLTPSMLAALLLQETHSVSGLLNRLEDRDLITRTRDRQDRRVVWVGLTAKGKKVAEEAIQISVDMANEYKKVFQSSGIEKTNDHIQQVRDLGFRIAGVREEVRREALKRVWN